jgi:hypothetical protein
MMSNPVKHNIVKTREGHRVMRVLETDKDGIDHYGFAEDRAYPTAGGASCRAQFLEDALLAGAESAELSTANPQLACA